MFGASHDSLRAAVRAAFPLGKHVFRLFRWKRAGSTAGEPENAGDM